MEMLNARIEGLHARTEGPPLLTPTLCVQN